MCSSEDLSEDDNPALSGFRNLSDHLLVALDLTASELGGGVSL